jgi:hypothetical protein
VVVVFVPIAAVDQSGDGGASGATDWYLHST